jgi:hypothetical protein
LAFAGALAVGFALTGVSSPVATSNEATTVPAGGSAALVFLVADFFAAVVVFSVALAMRARRV